MYLKSADDNFIQSEIQRIKNERIEKINSRNQEAHGVENEENLTHKIQEKMLRVEKSQSSFKMSDITNFVYGPFVSRFWMLRKHTIMMDKYDLAVDAPFYAWDCITLSIKNKWDLYLIIRSEQVMTNFLKLLIYKTNSLDGVKDSASKFK